MYGICTVRIRVPRGCGGQSTDTPSTVSQRGGYPHTHSGVEVCVPMQVAHTYSLRPEGRTSKDNTREGAAVYVLVLLLARLEAKDVDEWRLH